jgi:hypothetical protein
LGEGAKPGVRFAPLATLRPGRQLTADGYEPLRTDKVWG